MVEILKKQFIDSLVELNPHPSIQTQAFVARSHESNMIFCNNFSYSGFTSPWRHECIRTLMYTVCLMCFLTIFGAKIASAESTYPYLRDAHDPELQKAIDAVRDKGTRDKGTVMKI